MKYAQYLILAVGLVGHSGYAQTPAFADTIWAGTIKGSTKEVAHYQNNVKGASVTGATANQIPAEIWFPSANTFCIVFNNRTSRASTPDGRNGIQVYDSHLYDVVVGQNPCLANPMLTYWTGTGTVDLAKKKLSGTSQTEEDLSPTMTLNASYGYKKTGSRETLTIQGTAVFPVQGLDSWGDGWKLNPGIVTFSGTFSKTARKVSMEGPKQGSLGF
ncbi:MAG: hypothetical protein EBT07_08710 [Actinobacteria bacterium]|nr:hypothetical protein [Actinomycetota bacterium]